MPPRWIRRAGFFAALTFGALVVASVARPDPCADVWSWEHRVHGCCQLAGETRWTRLGGDCCDPGVFEDRDPSGTTAAVDAPPAVWIRTPAPVVTVPPPAARWLRADALIPERPPDRANAHVVLLI